MLAIGRAGAGAGTQAKEIQTAEGNRRIRRLFFGVASV